MGIHSQTLTDPDAVSCTPEERDYRLGTVREIFPGIPVTPDEVVYTCCGVRPLPRSDASDPGAVSRDHSIRTDIALSGRLTPEVARAAAAVGGEALGWDAARQADELRRVAERAAAFHGMGRAFAPPAAA